MSRSVPFLVDLTYRYLLPIAVVIAGLANGAGIGGATLFSPYRTG